MKREQVLLKAETIDKIQADADKMSISRSAVIRQIVEANYKQCDHEFVPVSENTRFGYNSEGMIGQQAMCRKCGYKP